MRSPKLSAELIRLEEALRRPGPQSPSGSRREAAILRALRSYFSKLGSVVSGAGLGAAYIEPPDDGDTERAEAAAADRASPGIDAVVSALSPLLSGLLSPQMAAGLLDGMEDAARRMEESALREQVDRTGPSAEEAARWAERWVARRVADIDAETRERMRLAVARAVRERLGVDGLERLLRQEVLDMARVRALTIARTEMADAFGEGTLRQLAELGASRSTPPGQSRSRSLSRLVPCGRRSTPTAGAP